jgi:long-chain fatty acid transport protein
MSAGLANASGFRIPEQSAVQVANANSGSSAMADDATTVITNPSGMAFLEKSGASIYVATIASTVEFNDRNSTSSNGPYEGRHDVSKKAKAQYLRYRDSPVLVRN